MTLQDILTGHLDAARGAVRGLHPLVDPRFHLRHLVDALAEIHAKVVVTPEIGQAFAGVEQAVGAVAVRLNSWDAIIDGLESDKLRLNERLDQLTRALRSADPDPATAHIFNLWGGVRRRRS